MANFVNVRGEGGAVFQVDLDRLNPNLERQIDMGVLVIVDVSDDGQVTVQKPKQQSSKADWLEYAAFLGSTTREELSHLSKTDLIVLVTEMER